MAPTTTLTTAMMVLLLELVLLPPDDTEYVSMGVFSATVVGGVHVTWKLTRIAVWGHQSAAGAGPFK